MQAHRTMNAILVVGAITVGSASARAAPILTGTFAGTAIGSVLYQPTPPGPPTHFDGTPISGTFRLDLTNCFLDTFPGSPFYGGCEAQQPSFVSGTYAYGSYQFGYPGILATVTNTASSQNLLIQFSVGDPYSSAFISLTGGPNAFVDGVDYATLHPGKFDLSTASIELRGGRDYATGVALTSLHLDQVPEPASLSLLAGMIAMTGLARVRRGRAAS